jgi:hypothetical protein
MKEIRQKKISNYISAISNAYRWSIRAALETEYPQGIIYIIGNTLKELEEFGINHQPYKFSYTDGENWSNDSGYSTSKSTSDVRGFPNKTNLKTAIYQAEHLRQEWRQLNNVERINAMREIWAMIEKEDMWLDWSVMTVNLGKEIYWYSYDEGDYPAIIQHPSNTISAGQAQNKLSSYTQPVSNSQTGAQFSRKILTYEEFLQQQPIYLYLSQLEQRDEYHKYLASMGVQPPSSTNRSYDSDNSNYGTDRKDDDSVW